MAVEGFWTVQFQGRNGAVVVLTKGKIFGGDSGHTFTGSYEGDSSIGDTMNATANLVGQPSQTLTARLTRKATLP